MPIAASTSATAAKIPTRADLRRSDVESKYLLSGFLQCACCGASITVRTRGHGRPRFFYVCASYDHRGQTVCANGLPLPMDAADDAIVTKLSDYVLDPEIAEG